MTKKEVKDRIKAAYLIVYRIASCDRRLDECFTEAAKGERAHRAMGRRICGAGYVQPVAVAAEYFAAKWISEVRRSRPIYSAGMRQDALIGADLGYDLQTGRVGRQSDGNTDQRAHANRVELAKVRRLLSEIDYAEHIAGKR
jgi:hypothetical protein